MMYQAKWIEGKKNLYDFCQKCLKERPHFVETIGHCGPATIELVYKHRPDKDRYTDMYLLYMEHPKGQHSFYDIRDNLTPMTYEQIRADRTSLLVK